MTRHLLELTCSFDGCSEGVLIEPKYGETAGHLLNPEAKGWKEVEVFDVAPGGSRLRRRDIQLCPLHAETEHGRLKDLPR